MDKEYKDALKDGRWQIRSAEIKQRDGYTCKRCGARAADGVMLHVHHLNYYPGRKPWEYDDKDLITLCKDCHREQHIQNEDKETYLDYDNLSSLKGKLVHIESATSSHIFLFGNRVDLIPDYFTEEFDPDNGDAFIEVKAGVSGVYPYWDNWQFSELNSCNDEIEYSKSYDKIQISSTATVTIIEDAEEKSVLEKILFGAREDLRELSAQHDWQRENSNDFDEDSARYDREEYEGFIFTILGQLYRIQNKNIKEIFEVEIMFIKKYIDGWKTSIPVDNKNLTIRDMVKLYIEKNSIIFTVPETQWAFNIIENHVKDPDFDFMHFVKHTKDLNLTENQKGYIEILKEEIWEEKMRKSEISKSFRHDETPTEKKDKILHLLFDIHFLSVEKEMRNLKSRLEVEKDSKVMLNMMRDYSRLGEIRNNISTSTGREVFNNILNNII